MFEKLKLTEERYNEINEKLSDINVINDNNLYKQLMQEYKNLTPVVEKYREYLAAEKAYNEAKEILDSPGMEKDLRKLLSLSTKKIR